jgi:DnaJ family protein C protein 28
VEQFSQIIIIINSFIVDMKSSMFFVARSEMDRLVEDLIQESMSRGEFDNLAGTGKPLKHQTYNPYVDFVTHKMNQVIHV